MGGSRLGRGPRLVAFGDISVDVAVEVPHLPRSDDKLWVKVLGEHPGGMGANAAAAFATLGGDASLVSSAGDDRRGRLSFADLHARGVDTTGVQIVEGGQTFWTLALLAEGGEKSLVQFETDAFAVPWTSIDWSILDGARFAHGVAEDGAGLVMMLRSARERGVDTSVDFEPSGLSASLALEIAGLTDVLFATEAGLEHLGSGADRAAELLDAGPRVIAVTQGREGCLVLARDSQPIRVPGHVVEAVDTTGAGDCFAGAFLWALASGRGLRAAAELANLMAAMSVTAMGSRGRLLPLDALLALPQASERGLARVGAP
jgi:ribokinase